jgi:hypothetical protein
MVRQLRLLRVRRSHPQNRHRRRRHYHNPSWAAIPCDPRVGFGLDIESRRYRPFLFSLVVNRPFFCRWKKIKHGPNDSPVQNGSKTQEGYISVTGTLLETRNLLFCSRVALGSNLAHTLVHTRMHALTAFLFSGAHTRTHLHLQRREQALTIGNSSCTTTRTRTKIFAS